MYTREDIEKILVETGVIKSGHFKLSSGLHSPGYLQMAMLLQYPDKAGEVIRQGVSPLKGKGIDVVIGPALGGILPAYEAARALGARALFAERNEDGVMTLRRGFEVRPGERVLLAEDVVTTGRSSREVLGLLKEAEVAGVFCLIDRSGGKAFGDLPLYSLIQYELPVYRSEECPLCREGIPVEKPGSRKGS